MVLQNSFLIYDKPIEHIEWPKIPNSSATQSIAMLRYLEASQWWPSAKLRSFQFLQLSYLLQQAYQHVPYYQHHYVRFASVTPAILAEIWSEVPLITRSTLQQNFALLQHQALSPQHGKPAVIKTSGSTGQPVSVLKDTILQFFYNVLALRNHHWHQYDFSKKIAVIRDTTIAGTEPPLGATFEHWGSYTTSVIKTSPCHMLQICDVREQAQWLKSTNPHYLMCYPTVLKELLSLNIPKPPLLQSVTTFGELVEPALRKRLHESWQTPLIDTYSSSEMGYIALQCPEYDHYHVQDEHVLVEILNKDNTSCQPGEIGRVVVTSLHNLAFPLIRYDIGDYAEVGEPCPCGRGLQVLKRIWGRQRNMLTLPNGEKRWPSFTGKSDINLLSLFKNTQFQVTQKTHQDIEISIVSPPLEEAELIPKLQTLFGAPFNITFCYVDYIPRSHSGKYEDFRSLV